MADLKDEVIGILSDPLLNHFQIEARRIGFPISYHSMRKVRHAIADGTIALELDTTLPPGVAMFQPQPVKRFVFSAAGNDVSAELQKPRMRALVIHESVHASVNLRKIVTYLLTEEGIAYVTQVLFLLLTDFDRFSAEITKFLTLPDCGCSLACKEPNRT